MTVGAYARHTDERANGVVVVVVVVAREGRVSSLLILEVRRKIEGREGARARALTKSIGEVN